MNEPKLIDGAARARDAGVELGRAYAIAFEKAFARWAEVLDAFATTAPQAAAALRAWTAELKPRHSGHRHRGTRAWQHRWCSHRQDRCMVERRARA